MFSQRSNCRQFGLAWDNFGNAWVNNSSCIHIFKGGRLFIMKSVRRPISRVLSPPLRAMDGHSSGTSVTGRLARPTRKAMRKPIRGPKPPAFPYLVLLPVGFTLPRPSPSARCALTAPFHPYRQTSRCVGGLLSVALSLGSPPPDVIRHRVSVEPGLSSPCGFPHCKRRPSSRPDADFIIVPER